MYEDLEKKYLNCKVKMYGLFLKLSDSLQIKKLFMKL